MHRGETAQAEQLACEAVVETEKTDGLNFQGESLCDLAEVLIAANRPEEAADAFERALDRFERKKNLARVAQVHQRLEVLKEELSASNPATTS